MHGPYLLVPESADWTLDPTQSSPKGFLTLKSLVQEFFNSQGIQAHIQTAHLQGFYHCLKVKENYFRKQPIYRGFIIVKSKTNFFFLVKKYKSRTREIAWW